MRASSEHFISSNGLIDLNGFSQITGAINNSGIIYFNESGSTAGTTLTVNGGYHGQNGNLVFNSALEGDDSLSDTLHITGNTDGVSNVQVHNLGVNGVQIQVFVTNSSLDIQSKMFHNFSV